MSGRPEHDDRYPEHEKLRAVKDKSQSIGEFIEWLPSQNLMLARKVCPHGYWPMETCEESKYCRRGEEREHLWPAPEQINTLLARFFSIDQTALDEEKDRMLEEIRKVNDRAVS